MYMPSIFGKDFFDDIDMFFDDPWFDSSNSKKPVKKHTGHHRNASVMNTDIKETKDDYTLKIDLPGFKKEEITAELEDGYLTICASKQKENVDADSNKRNYIRRERIMEACKRSFYVGNDMTKDDIKASLKHGVLKLVVPKKAQKPEIPQNNYISIE